jgi:rubrerythrin
VSTEPGIDAKDRAKGRKAMPSLKGSRTEENLRRAFINEAQASRRHLSRARQADMDGDRAAAALAFRNAESEISHAFGHLEYLELAEDAEAGADGRADEISGCREVYPAMARVARDEGFDDIAEWLETLARGIRSSTNRTQRALQGRL